MAAKPPRYSGHEATPIGWRRSRLDIPEGKTTVVATFRRITGLIDNTIFQWEDGYRRLQAARSDPETYRVVGRIVVAVEDALRKRLGSSFSIEELVTLYRDDSDWALDVAMGAIPGHEPQWDGSTVVDAAFYLYMREAVNFAGGSRRPPMVSES